MTGDTGLIQACIAILCLTTVGLHVARKNRNEAVLYGLQSLAVVSLFVSALLEHYATPLLIVAILTFLVKVVLAPLFFTKLVKRHGLKFAASTYTNVPETAAGLVIILILAGSGIFAPLANLVPGHHTFLVMAIAAMLSSMLLMINRKGALSQIVGVLSLENSIVAFAVLAGLEQSAILQAGIVFDVSVWLVIAVSMVSLVFRHHGSLDTSKMKSLRH